MINKLISFIQDEDGIATVWAMGWLVLCLALSGLAIDTTNAFRIKQMLQDTADIAAHAGVLELATAGNADIEARVEAAANQFADLNMGNKRFGDVLINSDILVGTWDPLAKTFVEMPVGSVVSPNAVKVVARQSGGASSVVGTFFLRFVGFNFFTLDASAVAMQFVSKCDRDGIIAGGIVKLSTQQQFLDGFCIHGQQGIDMSVANYFELGTIASMPDLALCGPSSGHCLNDKNAGVEEALRQYTMVPDKVAKIDTYITELQNPLSALQPNFIKDAILLGADLRTIVKTVDSADFDASTLLPDTINVVKCSKGNNNLNLGAPSSGNGNGNGNGNGKPAVPQAPTIKSNVVVVGIGCDFVFDSTIAYENARFATTAVGNQTVSGSAGVVLGRNDGCTNGGDVVVITKGSVNFASKLSAFDVEFIVQGDVHLASKANQDSIHSGTSVQSGGKVQITTKHVFAGCPGVTEPAFDGKFSYRLVQ